MGDGYHQPMPPRWPATLPLMLVAAFLVACSSQPSGQLSVSTRDLAFGTEFSQLAFLIEHRGQQPIMSWRVENHAQRVSVNPASGSLGPGGSVQVTVTVDRHGVGPNWYSQLVVRGGGERAVIGVTMARRLVPPPASCELEPASRYAAVRPTPLPVAQAAFEAAGLRPTAVVVRWAEGTAATALAELRGADGVAASVTALQTMGSVAVLAHPEPLVLARRLAADPRVVWVELDGPVVSPSVIGPSQHDDPAYGSGEQWSLAAFGFEGGRLAPEEVAARDVIVAVLDSGLRLSHEDLSGGWVVGRDFSRYRADAPGSTSVDVTDLQAHGTHVSGLIIAAEGNGLGIRGIASHAGVRVQPVKVFGSGNASFTVLAAAVRWAAGLPLPGDEHTPHNPTPADIINMSLGSSVGSAVLHEALIDARCAGVTLVAAAGNGVFPPQGEHRVGQAGGVDYPARYPEVLSVGSVDEDFGRSVFSDYGIGLLDVMAPGGRSVPLRGRCDVGLGGLLGPVSWADDAYGCMAGTSMATPLVAGSLALLIAMDPEAHRGRPEALEAAARQAAALTPVTPASEYGRGVLCLDALLRGHTVCRR